MSLELLIIAALVVVVLYLVVVRKVERTRDNIERDIIYTQHRVGVVEQELIRRIEAVEGQRRIDAAKTAIGA